MCSDVRLGARSRSHVWSMEHGGRRRRRAAGEAMALRACELRAASWEQLGELGGERESLMHCCMLFSFLPAGPYYDKVARWRSAGLVEAHQARPAPAARHLWPQFCDCRRTPSERCCAQQLISQLIMPNHAVVERKWCMHAMIDAREGGGRGMRHAHASPTPYIYNIHILCPIPYLCLGLEEVGALGGIIIYF